MKKIIIALAIIIASGIIIFFFVNQKEEELTSSSDIDISIDTDDGDEDINWDDYETYTITLTEDLEITEAGIYNLSGTMNGSITIDTTDNVKLILNNVTITSTNGPAIYVIDSKNVVIELASGSYNELTDTATYTGFDSDVNGAIYSECDLILEGDGTLSVTALYEDGIVGKDDLKIKSGTYIISSADDGIRGRDSVYILDGTFTIESTGDGIKSTNDTDTDKGFILIEQGTFTITANLDGIQAETKLLIYDGEFTITTGGGSSVSSTSSSWGAWDTHAASSSTSDSAKGIKAGSNLVIQGGSFTINSADDALHSNGSIGLASGTFAIASGDDGVHADDTLIIDDATITITESYEGLEASNMTINGGEIAIVSSDDGINVAGGNDSSSMDRPGANSFSSSTSSQTLTINDGTITINASGDGIDVNGSAYINGGYIIVYGPTSGADGALDYDNEFQVNGGTLIAFDTGGMSENISSSSSQVGVLINLGSSYSSSDGIKVLTSDNEEVINASSQKSYSTVVISSPLLSLNEEYSLYINDSLYTTFTPTSTAYRVGSNSNNMPNNNNNNMNRGGGMR